MKRLIFKLNKRGIKTDNLKITEESDNYVPIYKEHREGRAYISPIIGGIWQRIILLGLYLYSNKEIDAAIAFTSEQKGVTNFILLRGISKKRFNSLKGELEEGILYRKRSMIKIELAHAKAIMKQAYSKGVADVKNTSELNELMRWLDRNVPDLIEHPLYRLVTDEKMLGLNRLTELDIEALFAHELMSGWYVTDKIENMIQEIKEVEESPIVLPDYLKRDKLKEIKNKYREMIYKPEVFKSRFEEMAYYFFKTDEEEMARFCLKAVFAFSKKDREYELLTDYMLSKAMSDKGKEESKDNHILSMSKMRAGEPCI